jgi:LCP family protein required for cell wall assembly
VLLLLVAVAGLVLREADRTISAIQQKDPRENAARLTPNAEPQTPSIAQATATLPPDPSPTTAALADGAPTGRLASTRAPFTVLLIGVDKRPDPNEGVRSDTLILVRVDPQARTASMLSIPRDTMVTVPQVGVAKINSAFGLGYSNAESLYGVGTDPDAAGGALAAETVEQFLDVRVDYIAQVDFRGFERLIDSVGGVVVDVARPLLDAEYPTENYGVERIYIAPGLQVMDGRTALVYARTRHASNDFDRNRRQQAVLQALLERVRARGLLENAPLLPRWAAVLEQNIRTTLPLRDLGLVRELAALARDLTPDRILQLSINPHDVALDGEDGSDLYWNPADVAALVARWEQGPTPAQVAMEPTLIPAVPTLPAGVTPSPAPTAVAPAEDATVQVLNGVAVEGIAGRVSAYLRGKGFALVDPETVSGYYERTVIIDYSGRPATRQALARLLGIEPGYVLDAPGPDAPPQGYGVDIVVVVGADYRREWAGD